MYSNNLNKENGMDLNVKDLMEGKEGCLKKEQVIFKVAASDEQTKIAMMNSKNCSFKPCIKVVRICRMYIGGDYEAVVLICTNHGQLNVIPIPSINPTTSTQNSNILFRYNDSKLRVINSIDCISNSHETIFFIRYSDGVLELVYYTYDSTETKNHIPKVI